MTAEILLVYLKIQLEILTNKNESPRCNIQRLEHSLKRTGGRDLYFIRPVEREPGKVV